MGFGNIEVVGSGVENCLIEVESVGSGISGVEVVVCGCVEDRGVV